MLWTVLLIITITIYLMVTLFLFAFRVFDWMDLKNSDDLWKENPAEYARHALRAPMWPFDLAKQLREMVRDSQNTEE